MSKDFWKGIVMLVVTGVVIPLILILTIVAFPIVLCGDMYKKIEELGKEF